MVHNKRPSFRCKFSASKPDILGDMSNQKSSQNNTLVTGKEDEKIIYRTSGNITFDNDNFLSASTEFPLNEICSGYNKYFKFYEAE